MAVATADTLPVTEFRGRAMGSSVHIVATGAASQVQPIIDWAITRVDELEERWSRFLPTSEVSLLNKDAGSAVAVSADTMALVRHALEARNLSGGRFDPTLLQAITASGYDRTFVSIKTPVGLPALDTRQIGLGEITVDVHASTIKLGTTTGFDPGGIGKGLAADLISTEMIERGAMGALVNIGGDVRCVGQGPANGTWVINVGDDIAGVANQVLELDEGAVASSTSRRRRWQRSTEAGTVDVHHLVDPTTGRCSAQAAKLVTVIAGTCADAEWLATAIAAEGTLPSDPSILGGAAVIMTTADGTTIVAGNPDRFLR